MNHKLAYNPRQHSPRTNQQYYTTKAQQTNNKHLYQSRSNPQDIAFRQNLKHLPQDSVFERVKKLPEQTQFMRQTMNSKLAKRLSSLNVQASNQVPNKFDEFLRNTMSYKSLKNYRTQFAQESAGVSKQVYIKPTKAPENQSTIHFSPKGKQTGMMRVKSTGNLLETSNKQKYEMISEKIDRNKKMIEELKKTTKKQDYLRNVNHNKQPTFIDLDKKKQQPLQFKKQSKMQEKKSYQTPKIQKKLFSSCHSQQSQTIELSKSMEKRIDSETMISSQASISLVRKKHKSPNKYHSHIDQFQEGKKLGQGKFGVVNLARHRKTSTLYALKKIPKAMIKSHMMLDQTALQIRIQSCLSHRNILGMYGFFDDKTHLYIVLEYMDGGTLYNRLKRQTKLNQKQTAFIIKQMAEAVDYLHDLGIAHRDIKPQNIVISNNVYKLCDFGWAASCTQRRKTYCGTFDYVPPEILEGVQYDMTVDLWCLGVMTFELLTGKAPFYHISRKETMKKILNVEQQNLVFPEDLSPIAIDFIQRLVRKNPNERLKASEIIEHPFIKNAELEL